MRINICGVKIDRYNFDQVLEQIVDRILTGRPPAYVVTPNAMHIIGLQNDPLFQEIYRQAFLVVPDGVSLLWAAQFLNTPLNGRVNGTDLFERLCGVAARRGFKVFLLGGRAGAADAARAILEARYPDLKIVGTYCPPYGFETQSAELVSINARIEAVKPDLLFVGLGAPKQEKWIAANYQELSVPISVGIGVSFELVANMVGRAPVWMQKTGLEWLFRLIVEPSRLWKRYIIGNPLFILLVLKQRLGLLNS